MSNATAKPAAPKLVSPLLTYVYDSAGLTDQVAPADATHQMLVEDWGGKLYLVNRINGEVMWHERTDSVQDAMRHREVIQRLERLVKDGDTRINAEIARQRAERDAREEEALVTYQWA